MLSDNALLGLEGLHRRRAQKERLIALIDDGRISFYAQGATEPSPALARQEKKQLLHEIAELERMIGEGGDFHSN